MSIQLKLIDIQSRLKANKSQYNSFGKYSYRSCEDILEAVKPLLLENKAVLKLNDEIIMIGDRYYIKATATIIDAEDGSKEESTAFAREDETKKGMDLAQVTGSVSSYARKYALNGLFCIDDNKDSDNTNTHGKETKKQETKINNNLITEIERKEMFSLAKGKEEKLKKIISKYGYAGTKQIKKSDYEKICKEIEG